MEGDSLHVYDFNIQYLQGNFMDPREPLDHSNDKLVVVHIVATHHWLVYLLKCVLSVNSWKSYCFNKGIVCTVVFFATQ